MDAESFGVILIPRAPENESSYLDPLLVGNCCAYGSLVGWSAGCSACCTMS